MALVPSCGLVFRMSLRKLYLESCHQEFLSLGVIFKSIYPEFIGKNWFYLYMLFIAWVTKERLCAFLFSFIFVSVPVLSPE